MIFIRLHQTVNFQLSTVNCQLLLHVDGFASAVHAECLEHVLEVATGEELNLLHFDGLQRLVALQSVERLDGLRGEHRLERAERAE